MTELDLPDQPATEALAVRLAALSGAGDVIALHGEMGMGKSVFARAFLRALAEDPSLEVPSPTFSLVQIYDLTKATVAHFDLWRLDGPDALFELGWDEVQEGIMLIEWPERAGDELPCHALHLTLMPGEGEEGRRVMLEGWSDRL